MNPIRIIGAVAQLGERMTGSHEVRGSIPVAPPNILGTYDTFVGAFVVLAKVKAH